MRAGTCIHFKPLRGVHSKCAKGVNYTQAFKVAGHSVMLTMPCVTLNERFVFHGDGDARRLVSVMVPVNRGEQVEIACELREFPSDEQLAAKGSSRSSAPVRKWWD
jgi:hypothetical protein